MSQRKVRQVEHRTVDRGAEWRQQALLIIAIGLLGVGLALGFLTQAATYAFAQGVLLKTGIVVFMWWLALPQLRKLNPLLVGAVGVLAIVAIVRPQVILLLGRLAIPLTPVLFLLWLFWKLKRR